MEVNALWIFVLAVFAVGAVAGLIRGGVRIAVSLAATVLTMALVFFVSPFVSKALITMTPVDEIIEEQCLKAMAGFASKGAAEVQGMTEEQIRSILQGAGVTEKQLNKAGITIQDIVDGKISGEDLTQFGVSAGILDGEGHLTQETEQSILDAEVPRQTQIRAIESADIPEVFKELLLSNNNHEVYKELGVQTFAEYLSTYVAKLLIDMVSYLLVFVILTIVVRAVVFALDLVTSLPVLGTLNRLAGALIGLSISGIFVGFLFVVITLLYTTSIGKDLMAMIRENPYLTFLYEHNVVMNLLTMFR